jgi:ADP-ribose pyrophosphatase YjhB (NUDIX family)
MPVEAWSPIVYGRTFRADSWWRAVPDGLPHQEWLGLLVSAMISGGDRLDQPRFLLARLNSYWVTGVACMAAELSEKFSSDGHRSLYTFVGWSAPASAESTPPALGQLRAHYREWAAPLYVEWVGQDWDEHASQVREPHPTTPVREPWPQPREPAAAGADQDRARPAGQPGLSARRGELELWPAADAERLWQSGLRAERPFVLAVGWPGVQYVPRSTLTHAAVEGLTSPERLPVETDGLDLAATEPGASGTPSQARPRLTIDQPASPEPTAANFRLGALMDRVTSLAGEDSAYGATRIRLLIVTSDNQVLVQYDDQGQPLLPNGLLRRGELPTAACRRIARDSLGLEVSTAAPVRISYFANSNLHAMTFNCWLASEQAQVRPARENSAALVPVTDATLTDAIKTAIEQVDAGIERPEYREYPS